ncbi:MAG: DedA family protein [Pseudomonas sp.]
MTLTQLVADYGYLAVFVGAVLEGETILVLAGFAAHQGYLSFPLVVAIALCGGALGDQVCFFIGRRYGGALLSRFPQLNPGAQRVNRLLLRYHAGVIVGVRFMYGLRIVGPIAIGMSEVPAWRFILFNLIGAAIWAPLIAGAGYLFGQTLQWLFADIKRYEEAALLLIISVALVFGLLRRLRRHP